VDDEVERLERLHAQDPGDLAVAARLKAALLRAGRREEVVTRYRLGFVCPQRWDEMQRKSRTVRHCGECKRDVHLASTYEEFDRLGAQGHCAAVSPHALPRVLDGLVDAPGRGLAKSAAEPCLLEGAQESMVMGVVMPYREGEVIRSAPAAPPPVVVPPPRGLLARVKGWLGGGRG
jgi:hypothetical protein